MSPRTLTVLFRRQPHKDRRQKEIHFEGYELFWPNGNPVIAGLDAFCRQGQRLLGLGRHLAGCSEKLVRLICMPLRDMDDNLTRLPGHRVRRFFLERQGKVGRIHFLDGTPTAAVFEIERDEPKVLHWIGLPNLRDGDRQWFDLAASPVDHATTSPQTNRQLQAPAIYYLFGN